MLHRCLIDGWKSGKTEDLDGIDPSRYDPLCLFSMVEVVDMEVPGLFGRSRKTSLCLLGSSAVVDMVQDTPVLVRFARYHRGDPAVEWNLRLHSVHFPDPLR